MNREIILDGAPNVRDLGGIKTADGRTLKFGRLIRSGMLHDISDSDVDILLARGLNKIVDLRSGMEKLQKPDRAIDGVNYYECLILDGKANGITHDKPASLEEEAIRTVKMAERLMPKYNDGRKQMDALYSILVTLDHAVEHYAELFRLLLNNESGALLYHCTMGKDRVGVATMLILSALGVNRDTVLDDYIITRERCAAGTKRLMDACRKITDDEAILEFIYLLDTVEPEYLNAAFDVIDSVHGGMDRFLHEKLMLSDADINKLKELYLD